MSEIMLNATAWGVMMNEAGHLSFSPVCRAVGPKICSSDGETGEGGLPEILSSVSSSSNLWRADIAPPVDVAMNHLLLCRRGQCW